MVASTLTRDDRDLLRKWLAARPTKTVATWHPVEIRDGELVRGERSSQLAVRVTFTRWGRRDVDDQWGETVEGLRDAWHLVTWQLQLPATVAADKTAFRAWAQLGRR